jgi:hypothetical protein
MIKYVYISLIFLYPFSYAGESRSKSTESGSGECLPEWLKHHIKLRDNRKNRRHSKGQDDKKIAGHQGIEEQKILINSNSRKLIKS